MSQLTYFTESYPPYNYRENNQFTGISVDLLDAAITKSAPEFDRTQIQLVPWARGYKLTRVGKDTVLFSTTRTAYREPVFEWVGPIAATKIVLFAAKDRQLKITKQSDLEQYNIGAIRDDIGEQSLLAIGISKSKIRRAHDATSLAQMLERNRIDLWAYDEVVGRWLLKNGGLNTDKFEVVYVLKESQLYYAFSRDSDPLLRQQLQQGIDKVKTNVQANGCTEYENIVNKYR
ncbi:substrate-binding periplasmic protein [Shewanella mesophila]|uniref:substrate-binding periplasmic protein n=1 Tax=Shewanella mesophila TaxID=2864208 RepID=UPI0021ACBACB|nr:ABC transporter substrate-binding protein [Shewanella mesophila]